MNFNIVKQPPSTRSLVKKITKKIESLISKDTIGEIQILVTEVQCFEPDCVPIETLIILLGENSRWTTKILKPLTEVTDDDLNMLEIPSSLPIVQTNLLKKGSKDTEEKEEVKRELEPWVLSITHMIEEKKDKPQSREGLLFLQKYLQRILSEPEPDSNTGPSSPQLSLSSPPIPPTIVKMKSTSTPAPVSSSTSTSIKISEQPTPTLHTLPRQVLAPPPAPLILIQKQQEVLKPRHQKGVRQRGCPCCDPDNLDNIVDRLLYFDTPP
jgi:hypothetical protein